jgi:outer membrane protein assembly factor BamE (lipoprotein component of BamABCDE complex)
MIRLKVINAAFILLMASALFGCAAPAVQNTADDSNQLTLGKVQQSLKKGMKQDAVVSALGSPNMVTKDGSGNETWIYDKFKTEVNASASQGSTFLGTSTSVNASTVRSQKTLTVILKFKGNTLTDINYNSTSF